MEFFSNAKQYVMQFIYVCNWFHTFTLFATGRKTEIIPP